MQSVVEIPVTRGMVAIVDKEDAHWVLKHKWCALANGYVLRHRSRREPPGSQKIYLHRELLGLGPGEEGDHADRNRLNNRRSNLRKATSSQNNANAAMKVGVSGYRGVTWHRHTGKWIAQVKCKGHLYYAGVHDDPIQAARARDELARELFGEFALCNFGQHAPA